MDLLFIELMLHLLLVKLMYCQPKLLLSHTLILCVQITRGRVAINMVNISFGSDTLIQLPNSYDRSRLILNMDYLLKIIISDSSYYIPQVKRDVFLGQLSSQMSQHVDQSATT